MFTMMDKLYNWIWKNEHAPRTWRVVVNLFKKGVKPDPENHGGITLLRHSRQNIL